MTTLCLPLDVWCLIFADLPLLDVKHTRLTCRVWRYVLRGGEVYWRTQYTKLFVPGMPMWATTYEECFRTCRLPTRHADIQNRDELAITYGRRWYLDHYLDARDASSGWWHGDKLVAQVVQTGVIEVIDYVLDIVTSSWSITTTIKALLRILHVSTLQDIRDERILHHILKLTLSVSRRNGGNNTTVSIGGRYLGLHTYLIDGINIICSTIVLLAIVQRDIVEGLAKIDNQEYHQHWANILTCRMVINHDAVNLYQHMLAAVRRGGRCHASWHTLIKNEHANYKIPSPDSYPDGPWIMEGYPVDELVVCMRAVLCGSTKLVAHLVSTFSDIEMCTLFTQLLAATRRDWPTNMINIYCRRAWDFIRSHPRILRIVLIKDREVLCRSHLPYGQPDIKAEVDEFMASL